MAPERTNQNALGRLHDLARARLFKGPTPLEELPNLTRHVGGGRIYVKRDDCTELAFGGNKVRQLEFYLGEAQAEGADTILITGAVQSNFVRLAAAGANKLAMECHIQLEDRVAIDSENYRTSGNVFLDRLLGATMHYYPEGEDEAGADRQLDVIADDLRKQGRHPYVIHLAPGHAPLGALGYVVAAEEILSQLAEQNLTIDEIVVPSGSGATHGGLLFGLRALGSTIPVTGICVRRDAAAQAPRLFNRCGEIAELLGTNQPVDQSDVVLNDEFLAPGYGLASEEVMQAILDGARLEALMLDPTYTGKAMAGTISRAASHGPGEKLLLIHTGGAPAIFGYHAEFEESF